MAATTLDHGKQSPPLLRVLILEDNPRDAKLVAANLERGGYAVQFDVADSPTLFEEHLAKGEYDVILADYSLQTWTAMDALEILKQSGKEIPFIVVTGTLGDEAAVECIKQGAADYVLKDRLARLPMAVRQALEEKKLREERRRAEAENRRLATAIEQAAEAVMITDTAGIIQYVNPAFTWITGYTSEEALNQNPRLLKSGVQGIEVYQDLWKTIQSGKTWQSEIINRRKDGSLYPEWMTIAPVLDSAGAVVNYIAIKQDITERKRAEEAVKRSEVRWRSIFDNEPDSVKLVAPDGTLLEINPAGLAVMEAEQLSEVIGKSAFPQVPPEHKKALSAFLEGVFRGNPGRLQYEIVELKGTRRWMDAYGVPLRDQPRGTLLALIICRDITERMRAEEAMRASEARYRLLFESNLAGVYRSTIDGRIIDCNESFARILGYASPEEVLTHPARDLYYHAADREAVIATLQKQKTLINFEICLRRKDGRAVWVLENKTLIKGEDGSKLILGTLIDITERRGVEAALRASEESYRELFENASDAIITLDLAGNTLSVNKAADRLSGYTREESLGMNIAQIIAPEHLELIRQNTERLLAGNSPKPMEHEIVTKGGGRVTVEASARLIYADQKPVGIQVIARDLSERKKLEDQLRQAQKMEAVGRLAGGIAHDFNNLLTVINGYSHLLLERLEPESLYRKSIEEIQKAGERATSLTRQLLAFSRKQIVVPQVMDLNAIVPDIEKMLRRLIGEDIEFLTVLHPNLGKVKVDPGQIEQVLTNLVVNARDAMPQGGRITIETADVELDAAYVQTHHSVTPGRYVMLAVSDTGHGMDAETQAHIFEPFFTTKEAGKGTGLGLATVYGIVKQSGGFIWVYSEPGEGTVFKIYLPRVEEAGAAEGERQQIAAAPGGQETILVTEDQDAVRLLVCEVLKARGYKVLEASRGEEALRMVREHSGPIHLLVTDVVMPGMSGRELARNLAVLQPEMKVLYMSGYTGNAIVHHGVLEEGLTFIQKPFSPDALAGKVREVLGAAPLEAA